MCNAPKFKFVLKLICLSKKNMKVAKYFESAVISVEGVVRISMAGAAGATGAGSVATVVGRRR